MIVAVFLLESLPSDSLFLSSSSSSFLQYAWRVCQDSVWKHDNDDDGEDAAGSRLAHLLSIRNEDGVFVVVSRWFGGIHLGSKRFAHITNVARQILDESKGNRS